jgi:hypothetical protein
MKFYHFVLAAMLIFLVPSTAEAQRFEAHPSCNILWPCVGVEKAARGERTVRAMGGFGVARQYYTPHPHKQAHKRPARPAERVVSRRSIPAARAVNYAVAQIVGHPEGCPSSAFCGCGAAVRLFGKPIRDLWLAAAWFKFPRAAAAPGMVAVRSHHVFVLEAHLGGDMWQAYDANSGGHRTRIHARSIRGYTIVNPKA